MPALSGNHFYQKAVLQNLSFGKQVAEEETDLLQSYFVRTDQWARVFRGDVDIVYGSKGAGKSALYSLLLANSGDLFSRDIILIPAETPRGATAFKGLEADPPTSEVEFVSLWKLYLVVLVQNTLESYSIESDSAKNLKQALAGEGLIKGNRNLASLLSAVKAYASRMIRVRSLEGGVQVEPLTGLPKGVSGKIVFSAQEKESNPGSLDVNDLIEQADEALGHAKMTVWALLDRLDVAFAENIDLETNGLRALFRVYRDFTAVKNIKFKIFLRTDIWERITEGGFREASHITASTNLKWTDNALLNLIVRRLLHNKDVRDAYNVSQTLADGTVVDQENFFYRVFPAQVDVGKKKLSTLDWLLSRAKDGLGYTAPRELIHLLNSLRDVQVRRIEIGEGNPEGENLFARSSFKDALPQVSKVRLEQTIYAEFPQLKSRIAELTREKTKQSASSLATIWKVPEQEAALIANRIAAVGLFEIRGSKQTPEYWVPFLYRDALDLVQGSADANLPKGDGDD